MAYESVMHVKKDITEPRRVLECSFASFGYPSTRFGTQIYLS
jgi:hypothetical protein